MAERSAGVAPVPSPGGIGLMLGGIGMEVAVLATSSEGTILFTLVAVGVGGLPGGSGDDGFRLVASYDDEKVMEVEDASVVGSSAKGSDNVGDVQVTSLADISTVVGSDGKDGGVAFSCMEVTLEGEGGDDVGDSSEEATDEYFDEEHRWAVYNMEREKAELLGDLGQGCTPSGNMLAVLDQHGTQFTGRSELSLPHASCVAEAGLLHNSVVGGSVDDRVDADRTESSDDGSDGGGDVHDGSSDGGCCGLSFGGV